MENALALADLKKRYAGGTDALKGVSLTVPAGELFALLGPYGIPRSVAIPRATKLLDDLGLADKQDQIGWRLPGGMKRRLMIARALIHEPKFLILDEPTAGVDVELRRSMWDYLTALTKLGITILLTTHYLEEAERLAAHVAIINKGEIVAKGTMREILALHDPSTSLGASGYGGGKLEEIFVKLTSEENTYAN